MEFYISIPIIFTAFALGYKIGYEIGKKRVISKYTEGCSIKGNYEGGGKFANNQIMISKQGHKVVNVQCGYHLAGKKCSISGKECIFKI